MPSEYALRNLCEADTSSVVNIQFQINSEVPCIEYQSYIASWTDYEVHVQLEFTDPYSVSRSNTADQMRISVANSNLFVSALTNLSMPIETAV